MTATTPKRPPMLTATCLYLGLFALIQAISAVDLISTWNGENSADRVSSIIKVIRESGASQAGAESGYKIFLTVLAVMAASGVVFAIYTARGDRASRIGLSIVMPVVGVCFFLGAVGGSFFDILLGALSVAFTTRLWRGEAKAWFRVLNGEEPEPTPPPKPMAMVGSTPPQDAAPSTPPAAYDPASHHPAAYPAQYPVPQPGLQYPAAPGAGRESLPKPVRVATWTTFIGSAIVAGTSVLALLVLGLVGDDYERLLRESPFGQSMIDDAGLDYDQLYQTSMVIFGMCLALALGGLAASVLVLTKRRSGGVFLFVMGAVTVITSIVLFPIGIPFTVAAIVVLVQLRKPESRGWFVKT
ncbi:hypothetical protein [Aeromicrobium sp. UC242_57]|uniref:hypothetical protein n=1 Tax=Aeromicrobium sp. UC242_57 TaxID=3374624 RepID=UPI003788318A